jgi:hypothetical protein
MKQMWVFNPHAGGKPAPPAVQERTRKRILAHAEAHYSGSFTRIEVSFRGKFCYIDAFVKPGAPSDEHLADMGETLDEYQERLRATPLHLCRLRYFDEDKWSVAFYTYSHEKYEPCVFDTGEFFGTPEQGFDVGAVYLQ